jgi:hypothetical protein
MPPRRLPARRPRPGGSRSPAQAPRRRPYAELTRQIHGRPPGALVHEIRRSARRP